MWHQAAAAYPDPDGFRTNLNALIQALRNVTFILQSEKRKIPDFDTWYKSRQEELGRDPVLLWAKGARNKVVKQGDLETRSLARVSLTSSWEGERELVTFEVPPSLRTEQIVTSTEFRGIPTEIRDVGVLTVERRWVADDLPDRELLDAMAHCFGVLRTVVAEAHEQCGSQFVTFDHEVERPLPVSTLDHGGRLPCMVADEAARTVALNLRTGKVVQFEETSIPYDPTLHEKAAKRYGFRRGDSPRLENDPFAWAEMVLSMAKKILVKDGHHGWMVFLFPLGDGEGMFTLAPEDQQDKYLLWERIADRVERDGATGVVSVAEAWIAPADSVSPGQRPSESKQRREVLDVTVATADGRSKTYLTPFKRRFGRIRLEQTEVVGSDGMHWLEPVRRVWDSRAHSGHSSTAESSDGFAGREC